MLDHNFPLYRRKHLRLRDGTIRELSEDEIVPDGASLIVPLAMRDNAIIGGYDDEQIPTYDADDYAAEEAWQAMKRAQADAWRNPAPHAPAKPPQRQTEARDDADPDAAWHQMVADMCNAWRGGGR